MDLSIRQEAISDDQDIIYFSGDINEDAEVTLGGFSENVTKNSVFNLKDVSSINSCGVRAWINFLREVEKKFAITYEECPPEVVSQINMIPNFRGKSHIKSVYASYICEDCDSQQLQLFEEGKNLPQNAEDEVASVSCSNCGATMEMEELEEEFFSWIESA